MACPALFRSAGVHTGREVLAVCGCHHAATWRNYQPDLVAASIAPRGLDSRPVGDLHPCGLRNGRTGPFEPGASPPAMAGELCAGESVPELARPRRSRGLDMPVRVDCPFGYPSTGNTDPHRRREDVPRLPCPILDSAGQRLPLRPPTTIARRYLPSEVSCSSFGPCCSHGQRVLAA